MITFFRQLNVPSIVSNTLYHNISVKALYGSGEELHTVQKEGKLPFSASIALHRCSIIIIISPLPMYVSHYLLLSWVSIVHDALHINELEKSLALSFDLNIGLQVLTVRFSSSLGIP